MRNGVLLTLIVTVAVIISATLATAQESQVIHFQGVLTGPDGGPLRTDIYNVNFSIWDHATDGFQALWSEQQTVEVTDGLFDVFLGNGNPLSPDVFTPPEGESELRFLEIQVEGDNPMTPRMQIGKTPNSFVSSRVLGDIETDIGLLRIHPPDPTSPPAPAIEMSADGINNNISINWAEPLDMPSPALEMTANNIMSSLTMNWAEPLDMPSPAIAMSTAPTTGATYRMFQPQPEPPGMPLLEMNTHSMGAKFLMTTPAYGGLRTEITDPAIEMSADETGNAINVNLAAPPDDTAPPAVHLGSNSAESAIEINWASPPDDILPAIGMRAGEDETSLMIDWSSPPDDIIPSIEFRANQSSNSMDIYWASPPDDMMPAISMSAGGTDNTTNFKLSCPPDDQMPAFEVEADAINNLTSLKLGSPPDDNMPSFIVEANSSLNKASLQLGSPPDDTEPAIQMMSDAINNLTSFKLATPPDDMMPSFEFTADDINDIATFNLATPPDDNVPSLQVEANSILNTASFKLGSPPDDVEPAIQMFTDATNNLTSFKLASPPDDTMPAIEMTADEGTAVTSFKLAAPPDDIYPSVEIMADGIANETSFRMSSPPDDVMPTIEMLADMNGGSLAMYAPQAGLQGELFFQISTYSSGADLKFFDSAGGTTVEINSGGDVIAKRGSFGQNNTNNGTAGLVSGGNNSLYASYSAIVGGYGNNIGTAAEYSCLVGVDASLSADSTFMVDMPHIRFGDETDGYEFPTEDGRPNQMLATDGNGQLSWVDVTLLANENTRQLIEENKELKNLIMQLERRITELEKR